MKNLVPNSSNFYSFVSGNLINVCLTQNWIDKLLSKYNKGFDKHLLMYDVKQQKQHTNASVLSIEFRCEKNMFNELFTDLQKATALSSFYKDKDYKGLLKY